MARHNREGRGKDQRGHEYVVSYQPDWLHQVKVTRELESGRRSTKTLFRNAAPAEQPPGPRVRTQVSAPALGIEVEVEVEDAKRVVRRVTVEAVVAAGPEQGEPVMITISRKRIRTAPPGGAAD